MSEIPGYDKPRQSAASGLPPAAAAAYAAVYASAAKDKANAGQQPGQPAPIAASVALPPPSAEMRGKLRSRVRLLPLTIMAVALLLGLKLGGLWQGRGTLFVTAADAQQAQQPAQQQAQGQQGQAQPQAAQPARGQGQTPAQPAAQPGQPAPASAVASLADRDPTTFTRAEIELLANLAQRREQLEQRARELDLRESLLAAAEKRIDERIGELKKLEASIKQIVQTTDKQEDENLRGLVKIYETMKPEEAARIFAQLDNTVLLNVLERMKEAKVAAIMAKMEPAKAQDITVQMANRKQLPAGLRAGAQGATGQGQSQGQNQGAAAAPANGAPRPAAPAGTAPAQPNRGG